MAIDGTGWSESLRARLSARLMLAANFLKSESAVVTIEWVALGAGLVIGCLVVSFIIMQGLTGAASNIAGQLKP